MKQLVFLISISLGLTSYSQKSTDFFSKSDEFFRTFCKDGKVDYTRIKQDSDLGELIESLKNDEIPAGKEKAYLINAYNLLVINKIVTKYPISSPMDDPGFFSDESELLNGEKISLNALENDVLRKEYPDPRLHVSLVCGAIGCPSIADFAYQPEVLNQQLDAQALRAFNKSSFVYQLEDEKTVYLSEIFNWYKTDFGKNNKEVVEYINSYRKEKFNLEYKVAYYPYNWKLNDVKEASIMRTTEPVDMVDSELLPVDNSLQLFNAGSLLARGNMDVTLFNTLYTENKGNWLGVDNSGYRSTFVTHLLQFTIGTSKNKRVNVGFDLSFKSSGQSSDSTFSGIRNAFLYKNNDSSRVGLTNVGLRIKVQPFKAVSDFTIQSTLSMPTIKHPEGLSSNTEPNLYWADWDRITWWNQLFYTKTFGDFQLFTELDFLFRFKNNKSQIGMLDLPASVFISYFPTNKITMYAMTQHVHRYTNDIDANNPEITDWVIPSNYTASGLGFKYQLTPDFNAELLYTNFWRARNAGLGSTFNLGLKYLIR
ncbi:MAG: DUF547 domain-containing protein [Crocinitomicaceae bacterium]|nr:DUF547 domain-containing protein [Crocinitomicaceae bacterium]